MDHIMLDLETLDTSPTALVLSIGAVAFDPITGELGERFYVEFTDDLAAQETLGRTVSADTVKWWMQQNAMAKQVFGTVAEAGIRQTLGAGLGQFTQFVIRNGGKDAKIWANGADFDNVILGSLYRNAGLLPPWRYSNNRCFRTAYREFAGADFVRGNYGVAHNALDDAIGQANSLLEIMKCRTR